jgi:thioredoxin reductase
MHDVIVVGGGYAGMAAALQLLRARRKVLVVDAGARRNRFASHAHGFLGQDGVDPAEIAAAARRQLEAYPTLVWIDGTVGAASGRRDDFRVTLATGEVHAARRLLFATGVADQLPAVPGLAERWGRSVFHCPYCHGYELDRGRIGVIAVGPMSVHQAQLLPEWGEVTFLTNGAVDPDAEARRDLAERGVRIEEVPIERIEGAAEVLLADGRRLVFAGLFITPRCVPASPVAEAMGCALTETPMGLQIGTSEAKETSIPGVFACGDVARTPHSVSLAVGDGAWAGAQVHRSLVWPDG